MYMVNTLMYDPIGRTQDEKNVMPLFMVPQKTYYVLRTERLMIERTISLKYPLKYALF